MRRLITTILSLMVLFVLTGQCYAEEKVESEPGTAFRVYFSGIDNRGPLIPESNTDANVIITVNTDTRQILLIHIPRDFNLEFVGVGTEDKLCNCGMHGIQTVLDTVNNLMDTDIHYYIRFNFQGFIDFIDAMGGIDVYSEYEVYTWNQPGAHLLEGMNHINGTDALAYGRERYSYNTGDFQRGRNQEWLIKAGVEAFTKGPLLDNFQVFLDLTRGCYETNVSMDYVENMLTKQQERLDWNVVMYDLVGISSTAQNKYRMEPDMETVEYAKTLMQRVLDGETLNQDEIPYTIGETYSVNLGDPELNKAVQTKLNELGYNCGAVDGKVGPQTQNAINAYRQDKGLTHPGKVDRELCKSLEIVIPRLSPAEEKE